MNIQVQYKDHSGHTSERCESLIMPAFLKHFVMAGCKDLLPEDTIQQKMKGALSYFCDYLQPEAFGVDHFSLPPITYADPTKQGQFSNCAGLAIADFLAKRIDNALYTGTYEAAMGKNEMKIKGSRPDLLAFQQDKKRFAIEAKGYKGGCGNMEEHKKQSKKGGIPVDFSVACVSYNMYEKIKCNYYDPVNESVPFDEELFKALTKAYYKGFLEFLELPHPDFNHNAERFYTIKFSDIITNLFQDENTVKLSSLEILEKYQPQLIIPKDIKKYAEEGMPLWKPVEYNPEDEKLYIDNDRIGIRLN
jgi:hypothetical protein